MNYGKKGKIVLKTGVEISYNEVGTITKLKSPKMNKDFETPISEIEHKLKYLKKD